MQKQDIKSFEIYHTGFSRDCEIVTNYGKISTNTWAIRPCGREANYERKLAHKDGFTVLTALCSKHAAKDLETYNS